MSEQEEDIDGTREDPGYRRLTRSSEDRMLGGVAGGLARYFNVDPTIVRIAFGLAIFIGGVGIPAYIAGLLFVPADDGDGRAPIVRAGILGVIGAIVVGLILLALVPAAFAGAAASVGAGEGWIAALSIGALGVLTLATGARLLLIPIVVLMLGAGTAMAFDLDLEGGAGERDYSPATVGEIPADGYQLGVGGLTVDLRDIEWTQRRTVPVQADIGVGYLRIVVPADVCVTGEASVKAGEVVFAGRQADGIDAGVASLREPARAPTAAIDAELDAGLIEIVNSDSYEAGDSRAGLDSDARADMRAAAARACAA